MNILFIGDIFAAPGRRIVADHLQDIIETNRIDLAIANAENAAGGFGITPSIAEELFALGLDVLTSRQPRLGQARAVRLPRAPAAAAASGELSRGAGQRAWSVLARATAWNAPSSICRAGRTCRRPIARFAKRTRCWSELDPAIKVRFVDFHAEVTSEKMAMGWYLDGRVSAVIGTHTHVPTADTRILPGGTAYQTDCGMTGPVRFGDRRADRYHPAALPDRPAGAHGGGARRRRNCTP